MKTKKTQSSGSPQRLVRHPDSLMLDWVAEYAPLINMTLAKKLRTLRLKVKASQEEMATLIGKHLGVRIPVKTYRHWEYGTRQPRGLVLAAVEEFILEFQKSYKETMRIADVCYANRKSESRLP